jgi:hypothetical protein
MFPENGNYTKTSVKHLETWSYILFHFSFSILKNTNYMAVLC